MGSGTIIALLARTGDRRVPVRGEPIVLGSGRTRSRASSRRCRSSGPAAGRSPTHVVVSYRLASETSSCARRREDARSSLAGSQRPFRTTATIRRVLRCRRRVGGQQHHIGALPGSIEPTYPRRQGARRLDGGRPMPRWATPPPRRTGAARRAGRSPSPRWDRPRPCRSEAGLPPCSARRQRPNAASNRPEGVHRLVARHRPRRRGVSATPSRAATESRSRVRPRQETSVGVKPRPPVPSREGSSASDSGAQTPRAGELPSERMRARARAEQGSLPGRLDGPLSARSTRPKRAVRVACEVQAFARLCSTIAS